MIVSVNCRTSIEETRCRVQILDGNPRNAQFNEIYFTSTPKLNVKSRRESIKRNCETRKTHTHTPIVNVREPRVKLRPLRVILCGQAQYGGVFPTSIYSFIPAVGEKKRYLIDKIYYGTPVSIAEQIYLPCGQQPSHRFLASILVPLLVKYWLTPELESYLTNESMYGWDGRGKEERRFRWDSSRCKLSRFRVFRWRRKTLTFLLFLPFFSFRFPPSPQPLTWQNLYVCKLRQLRPCLQRPINPTICNSFAVVFVLGRVCTVLTSRL